jgi:hypothetical protein
VRWGHGLASWRLCARTHAGPGFLGPRRGHVVRRAPASLARGTMRQRRGDGGCGENELRDGLLHKSGTKAGRGEGS